MTDSRSPVGSGFYAREQIFSRDRLVRWSHQHRFDTAVALARPFGGRRVLDYGCGDGSFLALLQMGDAPPASAVGVEMDATLVLDCRRRFTAYPQVSFVETRALGSSDYTESCDAIFCMEVLEHVVDPLPLLDEFARLLRPDGTLVISVPIETGLPVVVKQVVRRVAGWRGIGHYPGTTGYAPMEMLKSVCAGSRQHIVRPAFPRGDGTDFHDHKGFNWRVLRAMVAARFDVVTTLTSPFRWPGPQFSTQAWFVARRRVERTHGDTSPPAGVTR